MSDASSHYIEFADVYKTFDKPVLVDVSFHVDAGETLAIIGRSGVGKSVSLGHIMGFLKPDKGRVFVSYADITDMAEAELRRIRKKVTMVFQSGALFDSLTVGENILFSLETRDDYNEQNKEDVVRGLLNLVDLGDYENIYPDRPFDRSQARRGDRAGAGRPAGMHPLRRAHHHGRSDHERSPDRPDAAAEEPAPADGGGGHPRSGPDAPRRGQGGGAV